MAGIGSLLNAGPAVEGHEDGRFLPFILFDSPLSLMKQHKLPMIPMLTGVNKLETKSGILGMKKKIINGYLLKILNDNNL